LGHVDLYVTNTFTELVTIPNDNQAKDPLKAIVEYGGLGEQ
jgi:hypothetical protein